MADLEQVVLRLLAFREARDWEKFHNPKDLSLSVVVEAAELLELFQWKSLPDVERLRHDPEFLSNVRDEIADVLIYLLLLCHELKLDPVEAAWKKIEANESRFPTGQVVS